MSLFALLLCAKGVPLPISGDIEGVHDPAIIAAGGRYLLFTTGEAHPGHIPIRCSPNLEQWSLCGHVFDALPKWVDREVSGAKTIWAPDISRYKNEYRLYYAVQRLAATARL